MKNNTFSFTLILGGFGLMAVAFISFAVAITLEILLFWQIAGGAGSLGLISFLTGEHLRSKYLKPPPTQ